MGVKVSFKFSISNLHSNEFPAAVSHFLRAVLACSPIFSIPVSAFHAFAVHDLYSLSIARTCTIARMSPFSGQCERLSRRLVQFRM